MGNEWCTRVVGTGPKTKTEPLGLSFGQRNVEDAEFTLGEHNWGGVCQG